MKKLLFAVAVLLIGISAFAQDAQVKKKPLILAQLTDPQISFPKAPSSIIFFMAIADAE